MGEGTPRCNAASAGGADAARAPCGAVAYLDAADGWHPNVDYVGDISFVDSLLTILRGGPIRARLQLLAPLDAVGAHRRELAQAAHEIGRAHV